MQKSFDPADALAIAQSARRSMAARAATPWWYPPAYGLGCGAIVASLALPPMLSVIACCLSVAFLAGIYTYWTRTSGLSVNGYRRGSTLPITLTLVVGFALLGGGAAVMRFDHGIVWAPLACGAVLAVIAGVASAAWDRAWRADILAGA